MIFVLIKGSFYIFSRFFIILTYALLSNLDDAEYRSSVSCWNAGELIKKSAVAIFIATRECSKQLQYALRL